MNNIDDSLKPGDDVFVYIDEDRGTPGTLRSISEDKMLATVFFGCHWQTVPMGVITRRTSSKDGRSMDLTKVIAGLYNSEINCRISTFWDGGIDVFLGDELNGYQAKAMFELDQVDEIPVWLSKQACEHYPDSEYAKKCKA